MAWSPNLGAILSTDGTCHFKVWAPNARQVEVRLSGVEEQLISLQPSNSGYYAGEAFGVKNGNSYFIRLDGTKDLPDPASRWQRDGVFGPSYIVDLQFPWTDQNWRGLTTRNLVLYELHVGTFTKEGTFNAIIPHLAYLKDLGVTTLQLMPVAQFPGKRNWGYDGVNPFAVQDSYGGPQSFKQLVNACHLNGIAVFLDVVYNHVGPEGNNLAEFGPYFSNIHRTPWGPGLNFDGPESDEVRRFFIENALFWISEYHLDGLRLDAIHSIIDQTPYTFIEQLVAEVHECAQNLGRKVYVTAETTTNNARVIRSTKRGGYGMDAVWNDDFHHSLHALLTGERLGRYRDYGALGQMAKALREGFVYSGQYSQFRRRIHGTSTADIPSDRFIVFIQNHDQVGNRARGERLGHLLPFEAIKLAATAYILSSYLPMIFMGEEYNDTAPFFYFISHNDPVLAALVRDGRLAEFAAYQWDSQPPDPQLEETFASCKLDHCLRTVGEHATLLLFYKEVLRLRRTNAILGNLRKKHLEAFEYDQLNTILLKRGNRWGEVLEFFHFGSGKVKINFDRWPGNWCKLIDSADKRWGGPGSSIPSDVVLNQREMKHIELAPYSSVLLAGSRGTV